MSKVLLSLSGGMDSTTLLAKALADKHTVEAVMFQYGSKHNLYEEAAVHNIVNHYGIQLTVMCLEGPMAYMNSDLLKTGGAVPEGHYEASNMARTVVPCRNAIFISILTGIAESKGLDEVWLGVHAGDHAIYPDCRPAFIHHMTTAMWEATDRKIHLLAPFLNDNKITILKYGLPLEVPYKLTRTCYKQQSIACGKCGACQERLEAFRENGVEDPLTYESREPLPKV